MGESWLFKTGKWMGKMWEGNKKVKWDGKLEWRLDTKGYNEMDEKRYNVRKDQWEQRWGFFRASSAAFRLFLFLSDPGGTWLDLTIILGSPTQALLYRHPSVLLPLTSVKPKPEPSIFQHPRNLPRTIHTQLPWNKWGLLLNFLFFGAHGPGWKPPLK